MDYTALFHTGQRNKMVSAIKCSFGAVLVQFHSAESSAVFSAIFPLYIGKIALALAPSLKVAPYGVK